jgi:hypothetical protein
MPISTTTKVTHPTLLHFERLTLLAPAFGFTWPVALGLSAQGAVSSTLAGAVAPTLGIETLTRGFEVAAVVVAEV